MNILAQRHVAARLAFESDDILALHGVKEQLGRKPSVCSKRNGVRTVHFLAGFDNCFAGFCFFGIKNTLDLHTGKAVIGRLRVFLRRFYICL